MAHACPRLCRAAAASSAGSKKATILYQRGLQVRGEQGDEIDLATSELRERNGSPPVGNACTIGYYVVRVAGPRALERRPRTQGIPGLVRLTDLAVQAGEAADGCALRQGRCAELVDMSTSPTHAIQSTDAIAQPSQPRLLSPLPTPSPTLRLGARIWPWPPKELI